ncbi:MAG: Hpt domain-containing protein [Synergistaceae bacterium]|jgi:HPt (histidine-containing phosphotransfer) domain-containing protein|nr:Hpt domain-containing protein [Synergistaceae bacterium]
MDQAELKQYVDTEKALERIRGNAKLFKTLLTHFLATRTQFEQLRKEIEANDREAAAKSVHAIKGVAANLSMTVLYELCPPLEALLKTDADTAEAFKSFEAAFEKTVESVNVLLQNPPA